LHALGLETHQLTARDCGTERAGGARRMEAATLVAVLRRAPDADHELSAGDDGEDQVAAGPSAFLGERKSGGQ
jgi:hypothetical protein